MKAEASLLFFFLRACLAVAFWVLLPSWIADWLWNNIQAEKPFIKPKLGFC
jgi:hypothetical protein